MRKSRTIYFNDARHYYLFVFDPPMRLEDAWRPVDEVSGTAVDTLVYGVSRGDTGLFFPSEVGMRFGADLQPFQNAYEWRSWENQGIQFIVCKRCAISALQGWTLNLHHFPVCFGVNGLFPG